MKRTLAYSAPARRSLSDVFPQERLPTSLTPAPGLAARRAFPVRHHLLPAHLTRRGAGRLTGRAKGGHVRRGHPARGAVAAPGPGAEGAPERLLRAARRRETPRAGSHPGRRPRSAPPRAAKPPLRQGSGVCRRGGAGGKCDPSRRGAARGRPAGGRGGRDGPLRCAGGAPWRRGPTAGGRPGGRARSSRRGRGRRPRRSRKPGRTRGSFSGGESAGPRRRSARSGLRLDIPARPCH